MLTYIGTGEIDREHIYCWAGLTEGFRADYVDIWHPIPELPETRIP
jgi:hypothetical protein